jgi:hypothetical protein
MEDMAMIYPCVFSKAGIAALEAIFNEDVSNQNVLARREKQ